VFVVTGLELDGLVRVGEVTSGSKAIVATYQTDAFGNPLATGGTFSQPFQFTGQQADPTGLYNLRARLYDPNTGRFMQQDTLFGNSNDPLSLNRYIYAQSDPMTLADPSGMVATVMVGSYYPPVGSLYGSPRAPTPQQANGQSCSNGNPLTWCGLWALLPGGGGVGGILWDPCWMSPWTCDKDEGGG
jgi:RHS repeat-associated protein